MNGLIQEISHIPVMVDEVLNWLVTTPDGWYVDGTAGTGGHIAAILSRLSPEGRVLGVDLDAGSLAVARDHLAADLPRVVLRQGSYAQAVRTLAVSQVRDIMVGDEPRRPPQPEFDQPRHLLRQALHPGAPHLGLPNSRPPGRGREPRGDP